MESLPGLGCHTDGQRVEVGLIGCVAVKARVGPAAIVEVKRRTDTALGAFYRRLSSRIGKAKAVTATARKVAVLFYNAVRHGMEYVDPGASSYETRYRTRVVNNLHRRAKAFGFVLQPLEPKAGAVVSFLYS